MDAATDEALARTYCRVQQVTYLSHETYGDVIHIAVEQFDERWEQHVPRDTAIAVMKQEARKT